MVTPRDVRDGEVEPELALDQGLVHVPLVAILVDRGVRRGGTTEHGLNKNVRIFFPIYFDQIYFVLFYFVRISSVKIYFV